MRWYYRILEPKATAGEAVRWSARQRLEFVTEMANRDCPDRTILANAIAARTPPATVPLPEEDLHVADAAPNWNDGRGVPKRP